MTMSLMSRIGQWCLPPAFHPLLRRGLRLEAKKDINEMVSPIQLRHIRRYDFGRTHIHGGVVLDAACGSGYGSDLLEPVKEYVGVDYADYCIRYAQDNYGIEHRRFIKADLYSLSELFSPNSFDTIVSFETLEHLDSPEKILSTFYELLKPQGRLVMSIPLNHPDEVYHKRKYDHHDVRDLFKLILQSKEAKLEEYLQNHLLINPLTSLLPPDAIGTWLGILTMNPQEQSP